jgi:hypothetical protein
VDDNRQQKSLSIYILYENVFQILKQTVRTKHSILLKKNYFVESWSYTFVYQNQIPTGGPQNKVVSVAMGIKPVFLHS